MKFTCTNTDLTKALTAADSICNSKSNFTVLSNILFEAVKDDSIRLKATTGEMSYTCDIPAKVAKTGSITIIHNKIFSLVRQFPEGEVLFELQKDNIVAIKPLSKNRNTIQHIIGIPATEFPEVPQFPDSAPFVSLDKLFLRKMIQKTIFCVAPDNTKYTLNGIFFECEKDDIKLIAIDGRRLALMKSNLPKHDQDPFSAILPQPFLNILVKILDTEGPVLFHFSDNQIFFKFDNMQFTSNILSGNFPDYKLFMPNTHEINFSGKTKELQNAVNLAGIMIDTESNKLTWNLKENTLNVSSKSTNLGDSQENIVVSYAGEEMNIGINYKLVSDILREIETEEVEFHFNNNLAPIMIKEKNRSDYFYILMPMKLEED